MNIVLIGKPGCGKGTYCNYLLDNDKDNWYQLSTGNIMKKIMSSETEEGNWLKSLLDKGYFAPDEYTINLIKKEIEILKEKNPNINIVFDGFPRTIEQAKMMEKEIPIDLVVYFDIGDDVIKERVVNRLTHVPSGRIYNLKNNPPKTPGIDDITGEPLTKRADDDEKVISTRINQFMEKTYPGYLFLKENCKNIVVSGLDEPETIHNQVKQNLYKNKKNVI